MALFGATLASRSLAQTEAASESEQGDDAKGAETEGQDVRLVGEDPPIDRDSRRKVPDYDGRGEAPTTAGEVLLWVPRVIFSPVYFVSEYVVRRPLGALVTAVEKQEVVDKVFDFFTFGPDNNIGLAPTGYLDFGFRPSVGLYFFWNDFLAKDNDLRARAATWGPEWLRLYLKDRLELWEGHDLTARGEFMRRSDWVFHGLGPESGSDEARFQSTSLQAGLLYEAELWRSSEFTSYTTVRSVRFNLAQGCCEEPSVAQEIARGRYERPFGADGYTIFVQGVTAELDTRPLRRPRSLRRGSDYVSPPGSGVRLQVRGEHATALDDNVQPTGEVARSHWLHYGVSMGGYLDVRDQRVLGLSLIADFVDPVSADTGIPFTEQVSLGGDRPMRGFLQGRLLDRSSAVAQLEYQWPVWMWIDGAVHYAAGNVFGKRLEGFDLGLLRQSFGMGLRATSSRDHVLELLVAFGSKTFDAGGGIENVRFVLGATSGF